MNNLRADCGFCPIMTNMNVVATLYSFVRPRPLANTSIYCQTSAFRRRKTLGVIWRNRAAYFICSGDIQIQALDTSMYGISSDKPTETTRHNFGCRWCCHRRVCTMRRRFFRLNAEPKRPRAALPVHREAWESRRKTIPSVEQHLRRYHAFCPSIYVVSNKL